VHNDNLASHSAGDSRPIDRIGVVIAAWHAFGSAALKGVFDIGSDCLRSHHNERHEWERTGDEKVHRLHGFKSMGRLSHGSPFSSALQVE
jgi:hypothetical protein